MRGRRGRAPPRARRAARARRHGSCFRSAPAAPQGGPSGGRTGSCDRAARRRAVRAPGLSASLARVSARSRTAAALRRPHNWIQLAKFGVVGASGYVINLAVYAALLGIGAHTAPLRLVRRRRGVELLVEPPLDVRAPEGHFALQGMRFFVVSVARVRSSTSSGSFVFLDGLGWRQDRLAGDRDRSRHAAELPRQQALVLPPLRLAVVLALAAARSCRRRRRGRPRLARRRSRG